MMPNNYITSLRLRAVSAFIIGFVIAIVGLLCASPIIAHAEGAAPDAGADGYVQQFLEDDGTGDTIGWDEGAINDLEDYKYVGKGTSEAAVSSVTNSISVAIWSLTGVFGAVITAVFIVKMIGRASFELMVGDNKNRTIPDFFLSARERSRSNAIDMNDSRRTEHWVKTMFLDFAKYFLIAVCIGLLLGGIIQVISLIANATASSMGNLGIDTSQFSAGGI